MECFTRFGAVPRLIFCDHPNFRATYAFVAQRREQLRAAGPNPLDPLAPIDQLIVGLLSDDPRARPTAQQVVAALQAIRI